MNSPTASTLGSKRRRGLASTVRDVAKLAQVSPMTVSRVINGSTSVREDKRARVMQIVRELNYFPNVAARSLGADPGTRIGLISTNPRAAYWRELLIGSLDSAARMGAQVVLQSWDLTNSTTTRASARKTAQAVGSVILPPSVCESKAVCSALARRRIPVVAIAPGRVHPNFSGVHIDDFAASKEMTEYLINAGHSRIAFIKGHPSLSASELRYQGFEAAMSKAGLRVDPSLVEQGYFTYRSGLDAGEKLLNRKRLPTAIFACNDDMAAGAISVAHRRGLDVPRDLSVVGFDDTSTATAVWPELTTIRQPIATMADIAMTLLFQNIRDSYQGRPLRLVDHVVSHELIERQSVAAPPND